MTKRDAMLDAVWRAGDEFGPNITDVPMGLLDDPANVPVILAYLAEEHGAGSVIGGLVAEGVLVEAGWDDPHEARDRVTVYCEDEELPPGAVPLFKAGRS